MRFRNELKIGAVTSRYGAVFITLKYHFTGRFLRFCVVLQVVQKCLGGVFTDCPEVTWRRFLQNRTSRWKVSRRRVMPYLRRTVQVFFPRGPLFLHTYEPVAEERILGVRSIQSPYEYGQGGEYVDTHSGLGTRC